MGVWRGGWTVGWVVILFALFAWEMLALASRRPGSTLSEHVWAVLRVRDRRPTALTWVLRVVALLFTLWIIPHFAFGWFTPTDPLPW